MITHTEEITFQKETGSNIPVSLQHVDQQRGQLSNPKDTYYVPDDGFHIVKLEDDEVKMNQSILNSYIVFKNENDSFGIILKSKAALALEQANQNRLPANGGPTPAPSISLPAALAQLGSTYPVKSLSNIFAQIVVMPRYLASVRPMGNNQLNTPFNMVAYLTWDPANLPATFSKGVRQSNLQRCCPTGHSGCIFNKRKLGMPTSYSKY